MTVTRLPGKFVWFELSTPDPERASRFYGWLLGWTTVPMTLGDQTFTVLHNAGSDAPVGALAPADGSTSRWVAYLSVADVDDALRRALEHGGTAVGPAETAPGIGRMVSIADPTGARLYLFAGEGDDRPDQDVAMGDFVWNELWTSDALRAVDFYRAVVGYTVEARELGEGGTYHVLKVGEERRAGVAQAELSEPPAWLPYLRVADVDGVAARAAELGGKVVLPPCDIPRVGRFAVLLDAVGASIGILAPLPRA